MVLLVLLVVVVVFTFTNLSFRGKFIQIKVNIPIWVAFNNPLLTVELYVGNIIYFSCFVIHHGSSKFTFLSNA